MAEMLDMRIRTVIITITVLYSGNNEIMVLRLSLVLAALVASPLIPARAFAQETYSIVISDHRMNPAELKIPAGQKIKLQVDNQDPTPEEFESHILNREKIIPGNSTATIFIGPLKPGIYEYFGDFNQATARGKIIAR